MFCCVCGKSEICTLPEYLYTVAVLVKYLSDGQYVLIKTFRGKEHITVLSKALLKIYVV